MKQERKMLTYFFGKLIPAGAVLFIMVFGVRFLGKSEFGKYNLLFNCINISTTFFIGWIQQSMLRFNTGSETELIHHRKQFIRYSFISSLLSSVTIFFLSFFYFDQSFVNTCVISSFAFTLGMLTVHLTYLQSQFQSGVYALTESLFYLVTIVTFSAIIFFSFPPEFILIYYAWLIAGLSWLMIEVMRNKKIIVEIFENNFDSPFFKKSFQYGYLITGWLLVSNLFNVVDRFIIRYYFDFEKVGVYSVVYDFIYRLTSFTSLPILLTLHPLIMKTWNEGKRKEVFSLIRKAVSLLFILMIAELTGYIIFGQWIFQKFFHLEATGLMKLMIPLIISSVLWQAALFLHKPLELLFKQKRMIIGILISLLSNIILNFMFIPLYGFGAAAYTTLASTLIYILFVLSVTGFFKKMNA